MMSETSMNKSLAAIVCGMPFSGTTFLSRLICAHPKIDAGFECGMLLGKSPKNFPEAGRFYDWMMDKRPPYNWNLTKEEMDDICSSPTFDKSYDRIVDHCHLFQGDVKYVLDKTPVYVYLLKSIMRRMPETPVIVIEKEKLNQYYSFKKRDQSLDFFEERYVNSQQAIDEVLAKRGLKKRLLRLPFEEAVNSPAKTYRKVINFINRYNPDIAFEKSQVALLKESMKEDMKGKKKLRTEYSIEDERQKMLNALSDEERTRIEKLEYNFQNA